jgi:hypothetical protein
MEISGHVEKLLQQACIPPRQDMGGLPGGVDALVGKVAVNLRFYSE